MDVDALELARLLADAFEAAGIEYAIGGAIAYGLWTDPRLTKDVDVNVFVADDELPRVFDVLKGVGATLTDADPRAEAERQGMFRARYQGMRIDVFVPSIPFYESAKARRVRVPALKGRPAWILSAEVLAVFKMLFFRGKDIVDLERLIAARPELDVAFVRRELVEIVGEEDSRIRRWDELVRDFGPTAPRRPQSLT